MYYNSITRVCNTCMVVSLWVEVRAFSIICPLIFLVAEKCAHQCSFVNAPAPPHPALLFAARSKIILGLHHGRSPAWLKEGTDSVASSRVCQKREYHSVLYNVFNCLLNKMSLTEQSISSTTLSHGGAQASLLTYEITKTQASDLLGVDRLKL